MSYTDPSFIHPDSSGTYTKKLSQMTTAELKAKADAEGIAFYRQQYEQDPQNPQKRIDYERYCHQVGIAPNPEINRLRSLPLDQLKAEFEAKGKAVEDDSLDAYRLEQVKLWLVSQPRYTPTPAAAEQIIDRLNALSLRGSVHELQLVFEQLVDEGKVPAPPVPVELYTREELNNMSAADMKIALQRMGY